MNEPKVNFWHDSCRLSIVLYFIILSLLVFLHTDKWQNDNVTSRVLPVVAYLDHGNFELDSYAHKTIDIAFNGKHYYTDKAPLPSLLLLPFAIILKNTGIIQAENGSYFGQWIYYLGAFLFGSVPFLLIILLLFNHHKSEISRIPILISGLTGSFIFVFSSTFFTHVFSAFLIILAYKYYQKNKFLVSGMVAGLAVISEFTLCWVPFIWILQRLFKKQSISAFVVGLLPTFLFILLYNFYFTGNPFTMLYHYVGDEFQSPDKETLGLSYPKFEAIWGLFFSLSRGLIFYFPFLFLLLYYYYKSFKPDIKQHFSHPVILPFIIVTLFISSHAMWDGGYSYGPRHLLSISALLFYYLATHTSAVNLNSLTAIIIIWGNLCSLLSFISICYSVPLFNELLPVYLIKEVSKHGVQNHTWMPDSTPQSIVLTITFLLFIASNFMTILLRKKCIKSIV